MTIQMKAPKNPMTRNRAKLKMNRAVAESPTLTDSHCPMKCPVPVNSNLPQGSIPVMVKMKVAAPH
jgi:hypothetical protein